MNLRKVPQCDSTITSGREIKKRQKKVPVLGFTGLSSRLSSRWVRLHHTWPLPT